MKNVPNVQRNSHIDVAALAAAGVAVAVSSVVAEGLFGAVNVAISITLTALIFAFIWPARRNRSESFAIATVLALAAVPAFGFADEAFRSGDLHGFLFEQDLAGKSRVKQLDLPIFWAGCVVLYFCLDRHWQGVLYWRTIR